MVEKVGKKSNIQTRPPVVVILGHVDHGKSSILEAIKDLKITAKESGGITQHIGAYEIEIGNPPSPKASDGQRKITFIDTPGHEAFSAMRSRGANVADIAILVVAASEGVKTQTKEAIQHIKKSGIPLIVAINKVDMSEADPERIKRELSKEDVLVEGLGGKVPSVEVSAKTREGIDDLLELILLVAEMEQLKGDISKPAEGVIIETRLDTQRGLTATLLLTNGILRLGDVIATSSCLGKVKNLENFQGIPLQEVLPSMPAVMIGFENAPKIGEAFKFFPNTEQAKAFFQAPEKKAPSAFLVEPGQKVLNILLKTDVLGSLEAIEEMLKQIPQEKVAVRIIKSEVGEINESDIKMGKAAKAAILGFRVKINPIAQNLAEREKIRIMQFDVIYDLVEGVRKIMEKTMAPEIVKVVLAKIKILAVFIKDKNRQVLGGRVIEGEAKKGFSVEVFRDDEKIDKGRIINLQRNKKDAEKVIRGDECGLLYEGTAKIEKGDILAIFSEEIRKGEL